MRDDAHRGARRARHHRARTSERKAYYSDYGLEQADLSAPGGDRREGFGTPDYMNPANRVLAPYPESVLIADGELNPDGTPNTPFVLADCSSGDCAYYRYLQGTSRPEPRAFTYPDPDLGPEFTAVCQGSAEFNGFYGHGIVDAFAASKPDVD